MLELYPEQGEHPGSGKAAFMDAGGGRAGLSDEDGEDGDEGRRDMMPGFWWMLGAYMAGILTAVVVISLMFANGGDEDGRDGE